MATHQVEFVIDNAKRLLQHQHLESEALALARANTLNVAIAKWVGEGGKTHDE